MNWSRKQQQQREVVVLATLVAVVLVVATNNPVVWARTMRKNGRESVVNSDGDETSPFSAVVSANSHHNNKQHSSDSNVNPLNVKNRMVIRRKNAAAMSFMGKKRDESQRLLCPVEYSACACEFLSPDQLNARYVGENGLGSARFKTASSRVGKSTIQSMFINCHLNNNNNNNRRQSMTLQEIPKLVKTNSADRTMAANISKYFKHITHLDLSHTAITHVPSDAFLGLSGLQEIAINHCKNLTHIEMFAFRNMPNLKTLIVSNNPNLVKLGAYAFGGLFNLDSLSLVMNRLAEIDGYIFSGSNSIRVIDFIGNPIKTIKSHAFHGLRNVSDLFLSLKEHRSPIEIIEEDSFITTAFVDEIHLEGIPARHLGQHAFRGLSHCKSLLLTHTHIEHIHSGAFIHANHIKRLSLMNSRVRNVSREAFRDIFNIDVIDLRGNYLTNVGEHTFGNLLAAAAAAAAAATAALPESSGQPPAIVYYDGSRQNRFVVKKILFEQNPIQCDCSLVWILANPAYRSAVSLPELCAGPKGYDCLRIKDIDSGELICPNLTLKSSTNNNKNNLVNAIPCDDIHVDVDKNKNIEIYSILAPKGRKRPTSGSKDDQDDEDDEDEDIDDDADQAGSSSRTSTTRSKTSNRLASSSTRPSSSSEQQNEDTKSSSENGDNDGGNSNKHDTTTSSAMVVNALNKSSSPRCLNLVVVVYNSVLSISVLFSFRFLFERFVY